MQSEKVGTCFNPQWVRSELYPLQYRLLCMTFSLIQLLARQSTTKDLVISLFWSFWWHFIAPVWPRLAMIGLTYRQPLLINRLFKFQREPQMPNRNNIGYGLIVANGTCVYWSDGGSLRNTFFAAHTDKDQLATAGYWFRVHRVITMILGVIAATVFQ
jgi:hypothetical protein